MFRRIYNDYLKDKQWKKRGVLVHRQPTLLRSYLPTIDKAFTGLILDSADICLNLRKLYIFKENRVCSVRPRQI